MTSVNTNIGALVAQDSMSKASKEMDQAIARLSSGLRINTAADDAAGMSIASKMEAQSRGLEQAIRNSADAQAMIDTTEGAHDEITNVLQRLRELAVQSSNDTNTALDRTFLKAETTALINEIDRISSQTQWNNMNVLDGTFSSKSFQVGANAGQTIAVTVDTAATASIGAFESTGTAKLLATAVANSTAAVSTFAGDITLNGHLGASTITVTANDSVKTIATNANAVTSSTGITAEAKTYAELTAVSADGTVSFTLTGSAAASISAVVTTTDLSALVTSINSNAGTTGITATHNGTDKSTVLLHSATGENIVVVDYVNSAAGTATIDALDFDGANAVGAVTLTSGAATDSNVVTGVIKFSSVKVFTHSRTAGDYYTNASETSAINNIATIDIGSVSGAKDAIRAIDGALGKINLSRSDLGAVSNRLDSVISNLSNVSTNTKASMSNIQDADFASETSKLTRSQILNQAATSMLAQANASKQSVLSLLQG